MFLHDLYLMSLTKWMVIYQTQCYILAQEEPYSQIAVAGHNFHYDAKGRPCHLRVPPVECLVRISSSSYCGLTAGSAGASEMVYSGGLAMDVNS